MDSGYLSIPFNPPKPVADGWSLIAFPQLHNFLPTLQKTYPIEDPLLE